MTFGLNVLYEEEEVLSDVDGTITRTGVVASGVIGSGVGGSVTDKCVRADATSALGKYGIGKCNSNGVFLLALCTEFDIIHVVTNTMFNRMIYKRYLDASPLSTGAYDILNNYQMPG